MIKIVMFVFGGLSLVMFGIYAGKVDANQYPRTVEVKKGRDVVLGICYLFGAVALIVTAILSRGA